jgi:hypothetical protein
MGRRRRPRHSGIYRIMRDTVRVGGGLLLIGVYELTLGAEALPSTSSIRSRDTGGCGYRCGYHDCGCIRNLESSRPLRSIRSGRRRFRYNCHTAHCCLVLYCCPNASRGLHRRASWRTPTSAFVVGVVATWIWIGPFGAVFTPVILGTGIVARGTSCFVLRRKRPRVSC